MTVKTRGYIFGILILTLVLAFALCGCSESPADEDTTATTVTTAATTVATTAPEFPAQGSVNATVLNVRPTPDTTGAPIGQLRQGDAVTLLSREGDWYAISLNGQTGYISAEFVLRTAPTVTTAGDGATVTTAPTDRAYPFVGYINATTLNVRPTANGSGYPIGGLKWGDTVTILSREGDWYAIRFKGGTGYINAQYVSDTMPVKTTAAPSTTATTTAATTQATDTVAP